MTAKRIHATPRQQAIRALPLEVLPAQARTKVTSLLASDIIHRHTPTRFVRCDPELYQLLVDEPDLTVAIWQALGISQVKLRRLDANRYEGDDGRGLTGTLEFLQRSPHQHLLWFEGAYRGPLTPKPIAVTAAVLLRSAYVRESDGFVYVAHRLDVFVRLDSDIAQFVLQLLEAFGFSQADDNFAQVGNFLTAMSALSARRPEWVQELAGRLDGVTPAQRDSLRRFASKLAAPGDKPESARSAHAAAPVANPHFRATPPSLMERATTPLDRAAGRGRARAGNAEHRGFGKAPNPP